MKTKILTLSALWIASSVFAFAQEPAEATPPEKDLGLRGAEPTLRDPSVSVPTENKKYPKPGQPLTTPKPETTPVAKATPKPSPASVKKAAAKPTPTPAKKVAAKPTPTPVKKVAAKPTPKPTAEKRKAVGTTKTGPAALRELENQWAAATSTHDIAAIQELLASDYIGVAASGKTVNKAGLLAELKKDDNKYSSVTNPSMEVRMHGNTAVVVGLTRQKGTSAAGKAFSFSYRWTDVWVERDGRWVCVASQSIRLPG